MFSISRANGKFIMTVAIILIGSLQLPLMAEPEQQIKRSIEFRFAKYAIEGREKGDFTQMAISTGKDIFISKKIELNENDIQQIEAKRDPYGFIRVNFKFKRNCWEKLEQVTKKYINKNLAILVNGEIVSVAMIKEPIRGGEIDIVAVKDTQSKSLLANLDLHLARVKEIEELIEQLESKQKNINDITITQEIKIFINDKPLNPYKGTKIIKGNKWRQEYGDEEYRMIIFYDGKNIWMCSPLMRMVKMTEEETYEIGSLGSYWEIEPERINGLIEFLKTETQLLGKEKIGDKIGYKIKLKERDINLYFDDEATLLKIEFPDTESFVIFSDFRELKGYGVFPYKDESFSKGKVHSIKEVKDIKVNQGISDDLFISEKVETQMQKEAPKSVEEMF